MELLERNGNHLGAGAGVALLVLLLNGCFIAEIHTAGTEGEMPDRLARLRVDAHHEGLVEHWGTPVHLRALTVDGVTYALGDERVFWLRSGEREISVQYEECTHGPSSAYRGRREAFLNCLPGPPFAAVAGGSYQLRCIVGWNSGPWVRLAFDPVRP